LANKAQISLATALKVITDDKAGRIGEPKKKAKLGMGSKTFSLEEEIFLLTFYRLQPSTSLAAYQKGLFQKKGTRMSLSTIS
jgi:hypothetical protein